MIHTYTLYTHTSLHLLQIEIFRPSVQEHRIGISEFFFGGLNAWSNLKLFAFGRLCQCQIHTSRSQIFIFDIAFIQWLQIRNWAWRFYENAENTWKYPISTFVRTVKNRGFWHPLLPRTNYEVTRGEISVNTRYFPEHLILREIARIFKLVIVRWL